MKIVTRMQIIRIRPDYKDNFLVILSIPPLEFYVVIVYEGVVFVIPLDAGIQPQAYHSFMRRGYL